MKKMNRKVITYSLSVRCEEKKHIVIKNVLSC